jgi:hypothetical protein
MKINDDILFTQHRNGTIMMSVHIFAVVVAATMIAVVAISLCITTKLISRKTNNTTTKITKADYFYLAVA